MQTEVILSPKKKEKNGEGGKTKTIKKYGEFINYIALPIIILVVWWLLTTKELFPSAILPSIPTVAKSFIAQLKSGQLIDDISISLFRVIKGFLIASILGITLGVLMGISAKINRFFTLSLKGIRQIPMMAWIPLIILWVGIGEASKITIIVLGAFFPVLVNTISGIQQIPKGYIEVGRMFRLSRWELFRKIYLPSAIPSIFVGLKLALGFSWMIVVAAELISSSSGIGYRINDARSLMQPEVVMVGMLVIGFIGVLMDLILGVISRHITPWSQTK
ncbi:aliphatic sulfonates ABC transporter permease protein SsuC [Gottschalkia acidurici 9a]|uniref:Aliphatic sulfonates ABC transporter permease protein SsuC n=1 Tax=Gottschalkia acidurici (strain ATCC 7906 / DSM 604 / BCRC 14475 / CIP 104303 / KCTC 5404 / NCIMB 10678 / 9a) TaxID=1128398 RepID=K0AVA7_GOTA9|nr:ABC transporter permease [Gottschalkia acidurici]AFS77788.1 aliphatic sulfonates ABC transporter permease protein SsuC [Gottschalkia acidurici 9a]